MNTSASDALIIVLRLHDEFREVILKRGLFITLEGTEGVGKSTNLQFICDWLARRGVSYLCTREPGGTPLAESLRELLLASREEAFDPMAELLVVFAARAQHLAQCIVPTLEKGEWVICDRFTDATYAYQGGGRGLDQNAIATLENLVQGSLRPDAVIILDVSPDIGLQRARGRGQPDRFEAEQVQFFERVRAAYLRRAAADPARYFVVDASRSLEAVQNDLQTILMSLGAGRP